MARIIGTERATGVQGDDNNGSNGMRSGRPRKPSFKTRGQGVHGQHARNIRATKVTLPASKVREIASRFNAVVVDDTITVPSSPGGKTSGVLNPPSSVVLATIQRFEGIIVDHRLSKGADRPKCILVRTNSCAKERTREKIREVPEKVPEELDVVNETSTECRMDASARLAGEGDGNQAEKSNESSISSSRRNSVAEITKNILKTIDSREKPAVVKNAKPEIKPKPPDVASKRSSSANLNKVPYKESYSKNNNRLSLPKVVMLDDIFTDRAQEVAPKRPNSSFLWGGKLEKPEVAPKKKDPSIEAKTEVHTTGFIPSETSISEKTDQQIENLQNARVVKEENPRAVASKVAPPEDGQSNLIANQSSLYRHLGRSQETVSSLRRSNESIKTIGRSQESVSSVELISQDSSTLARLLNQKEKCGSQSSLVSTVSASNVLASAKHTKEAFVNLENRVSFHFSKESINGSEKLKRTPSIRSDASYEDIGPYKYEDVAVNHYTDIAEYGDGEAIYDDVLNIVSPTCPEDIYETIDNEETKEDSDSSLDHPNSLYDQRPASQTSSGSAGRRSATSKSDTSDEWMDIDLDDKDRKEEFILLEEKSKPKPPHNSWSERVRRQMLHRIAEEFKLSRGEPSEEVYEQALYEDSAILDDFDDSSDSDGEIGGKSDGFDVIQRNASSSSPQAGSGSGRESDGIYGLMMSAGKKVKRFSSWSISQRLRRRMSKISISVSNGAESINGAVDSSNQKRWPSFKKKTKGSLSKFYLEPTPSPPPEPAPLHTNGTSPTPPAPLPLVLPPFKESKRPSLELPPTSTSVPSPQQPSPVGVTPANSPLVLPPFRDRRPSPPLPTSPNGKLSPPNGKSSPDGRRLSAALPNAPRPTSPPPPPPPLVNGESNKAPSKSVNDPSLYVESGLFGHSQPQSVLTNAPNHAIHETNGNQSGKSQPNSQWYSDAGLYEKTPETGKTRRIGDDPLPDLPIRRVSNSSWYSDLSFGNKYPPSEADSGQGSQLDLQFADEPLYQFYAARVAELEQSENNSDIGYEEIGPNAESPSQEIYSPSDVSVGSTGSGSIRPSALDLVNREPIHRTLWCQVPQVLNSGILESLTTNQKRLQEAKFELITSEASYYKSLTVLEKIFANSPAFKDESIIPKLDAKTLFGNIVPVRKCSESMLAGLEKCWQESILLEGICDVLLSVTRDKFSAYIRYCSHQVAIERTLKRLKKNPIFLEKLTALEASPACHLLSLSSFLLLPMQRVTRLPLLMDAIMTKLDSGSSEFESCQAALMALNKVVHDCNEAARQTERLEEMGALSRALVFPKHLRPLPLMSASRWLVRSGQVVQYNPDTKLTFSKKLTAPRQTKLTLFLFTDLFFVTKKKGEDSFSVIAYCARNFVHMSPVRDPLAVPGSNPTRFLLAITILENHEGKTQELMVFCNSESCRERWLQPFSRPTSEDPNQVLYETWDCPQVVATHAYSSGQPDELSMQPGDVVNVLTKLADGWFYGERLRDSEKGWFPGNYTSEVASAHVRARNLRQRHRLLALTSSLIQQRQQQLV